MPTARRPGRGCRRAWRWLAVLTVVLAVSALGDAKRKKKKSRKAGGKEGAAEPKRKGDDPCSLHSPVLESPEAKALPRKERDRLVNADAQALFLAASQACENKAHEKCFVGFSLFRERFPEIVEGYSNAGVALERLGRLSDAKILYRVALKKFPGAEKARGPLLNVLQMEAVKAYDRQDYRVALDRYKEIVKLAPGIPDAYINLGNINEALQDFQAAQEAYIVAVRNEPKNVKGYNALCRLFLMEVSGVMVGRFGVSRDRRLRAFDAAKKYCMEGHRVAPDDGTANMNLGMLYKESLHFDLAIKHLRKAYDQKPDDTVILTNLATTLSRNDQVPEAVKFSERIIEINDSPSAHFSIGTLLAPHDRLSKKGLEAHARGQDLAVQRGGRVPAGAACSHNLPYRKLARSWLSADGVDVDIVEMVDSEGFFGSAAGPRTLHDVDLASTRIGPVPLRFIDKQTVALTIDGVSIEGAGGVMYTDCEVYLTVGSSTDLPRDYSGQPGGEVVEIDGPVVSVLHPSATNYYHFTAEVATRLLLSLDYYFGKNGAAKEARLLLPPRYETTLPYELLDTLGVKLKHKPVVYEPGLNKRYHARRLHRIDWVQLNTEDPDNNDLWSGYLPSRVALEGLRDRVRRHQAKRPASAKPRPRPVVYICRAGVREINGEEMLLAMLSELLGDNLFVHDSAGRTGSPTVSSLQEQWDVFEAAQVVMGAHGAGLVNIVYSPENASLIEFPMTPQCNRCFGYIAAALNIDYWLVPEIACFYHLKYDMTLDKARAALRTLRAVLVEKGLEHIMRPEFDWGEWGGGNGGGGGGGQGATKKIAAKQKPAKKKAKKKKKKASKASKDEL